MTSYSLKINNQSGAAQKVAVFQVENLSSSDLRSLIWLLQKISNGSSYSFAWETNWGLSWGTTSQPLDTGVIYTSGGSVTAVQPNSVNGLNVLPITYNGTFTSESSYNNSQLNLGDMQITTDKSFTVQQSLNMSVAVYMDSQPIWAAQGQPNSLYYFNTNTSYYLTVTDYGLGAVIPYALKTVSVITNPTLVQFPNGVTQLEYNLGSDLEFEIVEKN